MLAPVCHDARLISPLWHRVCCRPGQPRRAARGPRARGKEASQSFLHLWRCISGARPTSLRQIGKGQSWNQPPANQAKSCRSGLTLRDLHSADARSATVQHAVGSGHGPPWSLENHPNPPNGKHGSRPGISMFEICMT